MGCLSFEVPHLQSGRSVLPGVVGNEQGVPHCCKQLHSGCAADFTWKSWLHVFIYMPFILSWLPILIAELSDFEANCAPSQPLLPQADKQEWLKVGYQVCQPCVFVESQLCLGSHLLPKAGLVVIIFGCGGKGECLTEIPVQVLLSTASKCHSEALGLCCSSCSDMSSKEFCTSFSGQNSPYNFFYISFFISTGSSLVDMLFLH